MSLVRTPRSVPGWNVVWAVLAAGCSSNSTWVVRTEVANGRVVDIPAAHIEGASSTWMTTDSDSEGFPPAFLGMEGSPVFDEGRVVRGYVAEARSGIRRGLVRIQEIPLLEPLSPVASIYLRDLTHEIHDPEPLSPGDSVCMLTYWGDCTSTPTAGTVYSVESGLIRCTIPRPFGSQLRNDGPCLYGLARAPVLAFASSNGEAAKVCALGPLVGTVLTEDGEGLVGVHGVAPRTVDLTYSYSVGGSSISTGHSFVVDDPERLPQLLEDCLAAWLKTVILPQGAMCSATIAIDRSERKTLEFSGSYGSEWRGTVKAALRSVVADRPPGLESVSVQLSIPQPLDDSDGAQ
jgi:hypothetical protein